MVSQGESLQPNQNKAEILRAATALFVEQGMTGLNVRAVATRAGVSTIGVYSHFGGKAGLLDALYADGFAQLGQVVAAANHATDPHDAIMNAVDRYVAFSTTNAAHYALMFDSGSAGYQPGAAARAVARSAFGQLARTVSRVATADLGRDGSSAMAFSLWALVHGYVTLRAHASIDGVSDADWLGLVRSAAQTLLAGARQQGVAS
ncbi:MAG: TetR/AcrR family transcriptional regulator [Sphingomonadaceae bacterium]